MANLHRPSIVVLDGQTLNPGDLSWNKLRALGQLTVYEHSRPAETVPRAHDAEIILTNKAPLDEAMLNQLTKLRCICVTATGYNNVDVAAARRRGIPVCNAVGYGTDAVAQHVFALLLELTNHVGLHDQSVRKGDWGAQPHFSYHLRPLVELAGKTMGIYGFGRIGQRVAAISAAFGMQVLATHTRPGRGPGTDVPFVDLDALFTECDVISLHAPLTADNAGIVNAALLSRMKPSALLINTARGALINETDLKEALENGRLAGAALDVLSVEPPPDGHPLLTVPNCIITPHQAWATREARERLMDCTVENVAAYLHGTPKNVVGGQ